MSHTYKYQRPAVTVDCVIIGIKANYNPHILLIQRKNPPFQNTWALPGGFLDLGESPEQAAARELKEETGLSGISLTQFHTFGSPDRDPREHVIAIAHYAVIERDNHKPIAADDAADVQWFPLTSLPELAFDHAQIIDTALKNIQPPP